jgi:SAM-dependent methyltransferase
VIMKINIGGGLKRYEGFVNLDIDQNTNPDYLVNLETDRLPFEDNSVDEVRAWHILEHIGPGFFHLLQEIYRVCKHGAVFDIQVPHPRHEYFLNDPTHVRPITIEGMRMFGKKYNKHLEETQGSVSGLAYRFDVDFEIVSFNLVPDSYYANIIKTTPKAQIERLAREANNFFTEILIVLTVVKQDA